MEFYLFIYLFGGDDIVIHSIVVVHSALVLGEYRIVVVCYFSVIQLRGEKRKIAPPPYTSPYSDLSSFSLKSYLLLLS